ncbi:MAG TPA: carboxypeptidase-like regulatory domain-containing protein, partial [Mariniflexile sp.]
MSKLKNNQVKPKSLSKAIWLFTLFACTAFFNVYAATNVTAIEIEKQDIVITGTVVSKEDGLPLPGVNIRVKGTGIGAITDFDGNYSIKAPSSESILVFSYIGFGSTEVTVGSQKTVNVSLQPDIAALDEVVIVGYGQQKKATLTGAIETISAEVFEDRAVTNPALSLQGQTPGLVVTRSSSRPGNEELNLQIRGVTSVNGGSPLIVIDGVPAINDNAFYSMNPDDIASISVLKDGAASIYGS